MNNWENTIWETELLLTEHYLRSDGPLGASPLRFIDVNDQELAEALKISNISEAKNIFLSSFKPAIVQNVLAGRLQLSPPHGLEAPGWFRFLILTCVIASISSEMSTEGDFRNRLAEQLNTDINLSQLKGVASLWEQLAFWCESKRKDGRPFRQIILPETGVWRQIGYSLRISFPSRRELERIHKVFGEKSVDLQDAPTLLKKIQNEIYRYNWSPAFISAYKDFKEKVENGNRILEEHALVLAIGRACNLENKKKNKKIIRLHISINIDNETIVSLIFTDNILRNIIDQKFEIKKCLDEYKVEFDIQSFINYLPKIYSAIGRDRLAWSYLEGILVFEEIGWSQWGFTRNPSTDLVRLLIRPDLLEKKSEYNGVVCGWMLTYPISYKKALLDFANLRNQRKTFDTLVSRPTITNGIKVGSNYLGLPCCIPKINTSAACNISLHEVERNYGELNLSRSEFNNFILTAKSAIDGLWILKVSENDIPVVDINLKFIGQAIEHPSSVYVVDNTKWSVEKESQFTGKLQSINPVEYGSYEYFSDDINLEDFCEVIYAGGIHGWDEHVLLPFIQNYFRSQDISYWDILRLLEDAGWLMPRNSNSWRARRWYLQQPSLFVCSDKLVILEGATCRSIREHFKLIIQKHGGKVSYSRAENGWSIPSMRAYVDTNKLKRFLDTEIVSQSLFNIPKLSEQITYPISEYTSLSREIRSSWSWDEGRFSNKSPMRAEIVLDRLQHVGDRSPDIYRIRGLGETEKILPSRTAAIIEAHRMAKRPLFSLNNALELQRLSSEGGFTREISRYLRLKHGVGSYLRLVNNKWELFYKVDNTDIVFLKKWYGSYIIYGMDGAGVVNKRPGLLRSRFGILGSLMEKYGRNWGV